MEYFIGISMGSASTIETGVVVIDNKGKIILIDKLYKMSDIQYFMDNFSSISHSYIGISLPWDNSMLEGKWRILSKPYQMVRTNKNLLNRENWTQRYSTRGCEYYKSLKNKCINICRFELYLIRQKLNLTSYYKERTPADCKFLQNALKTEYKFVDLPSNMMPMSQLEALVGALLMQELKNNSGNIIKLFNFCDIDVINLKQKIVTNL